MKLKSLREQAYEWAGAAAAALLLVFVLAVQRFSLLGLPAFLRLVILAGVFLSGGVAVHALIFNLAMPRLRQELWTDRRISLCLLACLACGLWLAAALPVGTPPRLARGPLEILTTGEKNPASTGSKLALIRAAQTAGLPVIPAMFKSGNLWRAVPPRSFTSNNQKPFSRLSLPAPAADHYIFEFETGPSQGIVEARWEGNSQRLDLYRPERDTLSLELKAGLGGRLARALYFISCGTLYGLALFVLFAFLVSQEWRASSIETSTGPDWIAVYALPLLLVWSLTLLAFWPGLMSWDSLYQWWQMSSGNINDVHPAFHTLMNGVITRIWPSPGAVALFQVFWLSLTAGWGFYLLRKERISTRLIALTWILFILYPVNQVFVITLWKDIPYSIVLLALSLLLLQVSLSEGENLRRPYIWLLLGLLSALAALLRHNGAPVLGLLLLLIVLYPVQARRTSYALALALAAIVLVRGPLFRMNHVDTQTNNWQIGMRIMHYLAAYMNKGIALDEQSAQTVGLIWPRRVPPDYSCYLIDLTANMLPPQTIADQLPALRAAFFRTLWANPAVAFEHFRCASSLVWRITQPADGYLYSFDLRLYLGKAGYVFGQNELNILIRSKIPWLRDQLAGYFDASLQWYIWRPAAYLYLTIFFGAVFAARQRSWRRLLFLTPLILHSITLLVVVSSQESRYQYPVFLIVWFAFGLIFTQKADPLVRAGGPE